MAARGPIPEMARIQIGIIGLGDMGKMYTRRLSQAGWKVNACDRAERFEEMKKEFVDNPNVTVFANGQLVSRRSDYIMYNVEAEAIDKIVEMYGAATKVGAIVGGQTSCKAPEIAAFKKHLPEDVEIISCHSLHGPNVAPKGQPLAIIFERGSKRSVQLVVDILSCLESEIVHLTAEEHDMITADTQAVTHAAFLSMGMAWRMNNQFPWEMPRYLGGIENVKTNVMLRIYSNKWHVYAGLAILNPSAKRQINQYATSVTELFKLMTEGEEEKFTRRIKDAGKAVFESRAGKNDLLLRDEVLDRFSLGKKPVERVKNNHLSLLAMVDSWWKLGIHPYDHMICSTPLFRMWLGITEYLYRNEDLLNESIQTALNDQTFRSDDLEFTFAARGWSDCVSFGNFKAYKDRFEATQAYFAPRLEDATKVGNEMIRTILQRTESTKSVLSVS